jgi:hypothetical protein
MPRRGDFVEFDGLLAVVVALPGEAVGGAGDLVPEGHAALWFGALWFGDPRTPRVSEGGKGGAVPEVWVIPWERCRPAPGAVTAR